jgi:hypothetical protein
MAGVQGLAHWPHEQVLAEDAFAHHVWATLRLVDTLALSPQHKTAVPGTYGSILTRYATSSGVTPGTCRDRPRLLIHEDDMHLSSSTMESHTPAGRALARDRPMLFPTRSTSMTVREAGRDG